ncbi:SycD/LcrH family type III secretion system chaperone [Chlamydiota bacterium]
MPIPKKKTFEINLADKEAMANIGEEVLRKMQENPGMTLKEATGVSDEVLEEIYHLAYTFYNQGKYKEAAALFQFLSGASPSTYKYVLGLASCFHQCESYEQAAIGFYIALQTQPDNPIPAYYITDCFLKQDLKEEALEFAEVTLMICEDKPKYAELSHRCRLIIESLKCNK